MTTHKTLLLLASLLLAGTLLAQPSSGNPRTQNAPQDADNGTLRTSLFPKTAPTRWTLGLYGGSANNHHIIDVVYAESMEYTNGTGIAFGLGGEYHATGWFSVRAELAYLQKNYHMNRTISYLSFVHTDATNNYLSLPVEAVLSLGRTFRVCGFLGVYGGYWLSGHREGQSLSVSYLVSGNESDTYFDEDYAFNTDRDQRLDAGLSYGFGLRLALFKKIDLSAEAHWYYGLTDTQKSYMTQLNPRYNTTRVIRVGLAYWL